MRTVAIGFGLLNVLLWGAATSSGQNIYAGATVSYSRLLTPRNYTNSIKQNGLDLTNGFKIGTGFRLQFRNSPLGLKLQFNYGRFDGSGQTDFIAPPWS